MQCMHRSKSALAMFDAFVQFVQWFIVIRHASRIIFHILAKPRFQLELPSE
jgi:hypothetical protein